MDLAAQEIALGAPHLYDPAGALVDLHGHAQRIWNLLSKGDVFCEIIQKPVILDVMEWIFDRKTPHQKYYLSSFQAHILHPGAARQRLHVDTPVPEPLPPWTIKANTIWVLDPFMLGSGATECLPGSHSTYRKPGPADQDHPGVIAIEAPIGSVVVTHGALWHRGGANSSNASRVALLGSFAASYAREIANEENHSVVLDVRVAANASPTLRQILGLEHGVRPGATNRVFSPLRL
jgi:ectoine hydroxylase-related dioxygenase (phytanoyl-CoA dioxygenase family)